MPKPDILGNIWTIFKLGEHKPFKLDLFALLILAFGLYSDRAIGFAIDSEVNGAKRPYSDFTYDVKSILNDNVFKTLACDFLR